MDFFLYYLFYTIVWNHFSKNKVPIPQTSKVTLSWSLELINILPLIEYKERATHISQPSYELGTLQTLFYLILTTANAGS